MRKNRYVSVLKQKAGEMEAIAKLSSRVWVEWTPLIELLADDFDPKECSPKEFAQKTAKTLIKSTPEGATILLYFDRFTKLSNQVRLVLSELATSGRQVIPTLSLHTPSDLRDSLLAILDDGSEAALRISLSEVNDNLENFLKLQMPQLLDHPNRSHLLLDLGQIEQTDLEYLSMTAPMVIERMPKLEEWRSITILGTSIPQTLGVEAGKVANLPRVEYALWKRLKLAAKLRDLDFGDYAITAPELVNFDPEKMTISPKILYTLEDSWLVHKGKGLKRGGGWAQCFSMSGKIASHQSFCGSHYSDGDDYIQRCANKTASAGNSKVWKRVGTNHHITFVAHQIANSVGS